MIILLPHFPVLVTSKGMKHGQAIMVTDYGPEAHKIWTVVMDDTGEVWDVPNPEIRFRKNWTMGRRVVGHGKEQDAFMDREKGYQKGDPQLYGQDGL